MAVAVAVVLIPAARDAVLERPEGYLTVMALNLWRVFIATERQMLAHVGSTHSPDLKHYKLTLRCYSHSLQTKYSRKRIM